MSQSVFRVSTHLSIAWGVTLAILTLVEWNSLSRNPIEQQVLVPFIQREITVSSPAQSGGGEVDFDGVVTAPAENGPGLLYTVEFHFNGPFFLACFFIPVLLFYALENMMLWLQRKSG